MKSLRFSAYLHALNPLRYSMAYLLIGGVSWLTMVTTPPRPQPEFMTNPKTATDFAKRCEALSNEEKFQQALDSCNRAISLDASLAAGYFGRSRARRHLGDKVGGREDYYQGRRLKMEAARRRYMAEKNLIIKRH